MLLIGYQQTLSITLRVIDSYRFNIGARPEKIVRVVHSFYSPLILIDL